MNYVFKFHRDDEGFDIGLEAKPKGEMKIDLEKVSDKFDRLHIKSSVVLVTEIDGAHVSIYPDGRVMVFDVDEEEGREIASRVYKIITEPLQTGKRGGKALFVGRFQPFHLGHLKAIKDILKKNRSVAIVIGSAQEKRTHENPFSAEERKKMIENALKEAGVKNYEVYSVGDFHNDRQWVRAIRKLTDYDVVYTMNPWTQRCFESEGVPVRKHQLYDKEKYSGTEIRRRIFENKEWKGLVPKAVAKYIKYLKGEERIKKLSK